MTPEASLKANPQNNESECGSCWRPGSKRASVFLGLDCDPEQCCPDHGRRLWPWPCRGEPSCQSCSQPYSIESLWHDSPSQSSNSSSHTYPTPALRLSFPLVLASATVSYPAPAMPAPQYACPNNACFDANSWSYGADGQPLLTWLSKTFALSHHQRCWLARPTTSSSQSRFRIRRQVSYRPVRQRRRSC